MFIGFFPSFSLDDLSDESDDILKFAGWWLAASKNLVNNCYLGTFGQKCGQKCGFKHFLFSSLFGEMIQFDKYFSNGLKPPTSLLITVTLSETISHSP